MGDPGAEPLIALRRPGFRRTMKPRQTAPECRAQVVTVGGLPYLVSLESALWAMLKAIRRREGVTQGALINAIRRAYGTDQRKRATECWSRAFDLSASSDGLRHFIPLADSRYFHV